MQPRPYHDKYDLRKVQIAMMNWVKQAGDCNYCHKGDVRHRLFNGGYQHQPEDMMHLWEDANGDVFGWTTLYPFWESFDLALAPDYCYTDFHISAFQWAEANVIAYAERDGKPLKQLIAESCGCDPRYDAFLIERGYTYHEQTICYTEHNLTQLPDAMLPEGFYFHSATVDDLENLADVHNHSFTNKWTAEIYGKVFTAPYQEYEFVVVAPDGRFAAFTQVWLDEVNKSILFEPVGTHEDFRRMGIGKALMVYVIKRMQAEHHVQRAIVCHERADKNPASTALYASVGFRQVYQIHDYKKAL